MSYLDHDGLAYFKSKLDRTFIADIVFDDGDILLYGGDGTLLKTVVQEGTVTQKKSVTNKEYPILLCWDADAEEDQTMKTVWYGLDARINPKFGYLYARRYYTEHPSYERTSVPSTRAEWHHMFTDAVSAPMGEVYEYLDRNADGGEHRMELRLYGNPLSQYVDTPNHNEATDAVSIGVGATRGDKLTFFGYCPSTPIYLENGSTMRKSTVRGDQYGKDIITRDWLNLNGSVTGLVHTYMDETIDGYKTFLKTVTIDSGNDNAKAGLNVQGDVNIDSGDNTKPSNLYVQGNSHIHGNEDIDGNLNVDGTSTLDGNVHMKHNLDVDGNLNVDGTSDQHGNVHMYNNLTVDKNAAITGNETVGGTLTVTGKITGNGGAAVTGNTAITGNLTVSGTTTTEDLSVTDDATIGDDLTVNGDELVKGNETVNGNSNVGGNINVSGAVNKKSGNTITEYVTYVTSQPATREAISQNLLALGKGLAKDSQGKIYVDFSQIDANTKAAILAGLDIQIPLKSNIEIIVNSQASDRTDSFSLEFSDRVSTPFERINKAVEWASSKLALGKYKVTIRIVGSNNASNPRVYTESVSLPEVNSSSGYISIETYNGIKDVIIEPSQTTAGHRNSCITAGSGACHWVLKHLICHYYLEETSTPGLAMALIGATTSGAQVDVYGCDCLVKCSHDTIAGEGYTIRMIDGDAGGAIHLFPDDLGSKVEFALPSTNTAGISIDVLNASRDGRIYFRRSTVSENSDYTCKGTCSNFVNAWQSGGTNLLGGSGTQVAFVVASGQSVTGNRYRAQTGSYIIGPASGFPGQEAADVSTVVASSKGCWVSSVNPA